MKYTEKYMVVPFGEENDLSYDEKLEKKMTEVLYDNTLPVSTIVKKYNNLLSKLLVNFKPNSIQSDEIANLHADVLALRDTTNKGGRYFSDLLKNIIKPVDNLVKTDNEKIEPMNTDESRFSTPKLNNKIRANKINETTKHRQINRTKKFFENKKILPKSIETNDLLNKTEVMQIYKSPHEKATTRSNNFAKLVNQQSNTNFPQNPDNFGKAKTKKASNSIAPYQIPNKTGQIGKSLKWFTKKYF